jgi:uncharacterized protein (DUF1697 family)
MDTLVVFLKGVNVGGHRTFRPSVLAKQMRRYDVVNIGAAGTFVVRRKVGRAKLRAEFVRRLPFEADVIICDARDILRVTDRTPFAGQPSGPAILQFVSVLAKRPRASLRVPLDVPSDGEWCVRVLARQDRFMFGVCRRQMKAIGCLGQLEKLFGVPITTRSWSTISTIARLLKSDETSRTAQ